MIGVACACGLLDIYSAVNSVRVRQRSHVQLQQFRRPLVSAPHATGIPVVLARLVHTHWHHALPSVRLRRAFMLRSLYGETLCMHMGAHHAHVQIFLHQKECPAQHGLLQAPAAQKDATVARTR